MATIATAGAGNWSAGGTWVGGVKPQAGDDAQIDHAVTIDENIAIDNLDNNNTLTFGGNYSITMTGGGDIDNDAGTINASNNNVTFKSSNTSMFTWDMDSGTWTDGSGEHHWEYADLNIAAHYSGFNSGSYFYDENCIFRASAGSKRWTMNRPTTFAAGKTFILSDGINIFYLYLTAGNLTAVGSSGNEITFEGDNGGNRKGYILHSGTSTVLNYQYCKFDSMYNSFYLSTVNGDNITYANNEISRSDFANTIAGNCTNNIVIDTCTWYSNDAYLSVSHSTGTSQFDDCTSYSNQNAFKQTGATATYNRCKMYSHSQQNFYCLTTATSNLNSCLLYDAGFENIDNLSAPAITIINCTLSDPGGFYPNLYTSQAEGETCVVTNCNITIGKYGINTVGADDPVVTYTNVYGATTDNYNGMADPTGSNGNISVDPLFQDAAGDDYDLQSVDHGDPADSPCLNVGTGVGTPAFDINNVSWKNANPEMGCYTQLAGAAPVAGAIEPDTMLGVHF